MTTMPLPLEKVISGGQTGVDQVALDVAQTLDYETGGTAPLGWRTDDGLAPWLRGYGLRESISPNYRPRTRQNVRDAHLTVWFGDPTSPGGRLTIGTCQQLNIPHLINPTAAELRSRLETLQIKVLNVAGNRLRTNPAASEQARAVLMEALKR